MNYSNTKRDTFLIVLLIIAFLMLFAITLSNSKKISNLESELESSQERLNSLEENKTYENNVSGERSQTSVSTKKNDEVIDYYEIEQKPKSKKTSYTKKDEKVINYLESVKDNVDDLGTNGESKAKGTFIGLVDFLFYEGEIKGVKFKELSNNGKLKVLKISTNIDSKLENKFPNYKDKISSNTKVAFNKASDIIKKGATDISDFSKEKLGSENYNTIIKSKDELIYYNRKARGVIGETAGKLTTSLKEKIKTWYQNFKS